jgi:hypothetical protein
VRALVAPALQQRQQVGGGARVDGVEGLVQQDQPGVLQQHAREQHALRLAGRQLAQPALFEAGQAHRGQRLQDTACGRPRSPRKLPMRAHRPSATTSCTAPGSARSRSDGLRQVGHALRRVAFDAALKTRDGAAQRPQQRALAGAVGADHRRQRAWRRSGR